MRESPVDVVIVGAGPNGLSAAIVLAQAGLEVLVREWREQVGGAAKSLELTLPGFVHDPFSAIYPLAAGSPFLAKLPLADYGLTWVHSPAPLAHPFDSGPPALLERSLDATVASLGRSGREYRRFVSNFGAAWDRLAADMLGPLHLPRHPLLFGRFGVRAIRSGAGIAGRSGPGDRAAALIAGSAAHSGLPLEARATAAFALVLHAAGHAVGWPFPAGGAGRITQAMARYLESLGGRIETGAPVESLDELPRARAVVLDLTARQVLRVAGSRLPTRYRSALQGFRYGLGVFKMDWALAGPVPWRDPMLARAATVHLGGEFGEIAAAMRAPAEGRIADRPFVIFAQPSLFDPTRAPEGRHTAWAYCHVPHAHEGDASAAIEDQIERFAPGFRDLVLARSSLPPQRLEALDPNLVGGDVNGGAPDLFQLFFRPAVRRDPYRTPAEGVFVCSASTPPGGGVHGMCGYHAARSVLRWMELPAPPRRPRSPEIASAASTARST